MNIKFRRGLLGLKDFKMILKVTTAQGCYTEIFQVKYATCTLLDGALFWCNSYVQLVGLDDAYETTWKRLKQMLTDEYCPKNEVQKMETELWNLSVKGTDIDSLKAESGEGWGPGGGVKGGRGGGGGTAKGGDNKRKWDDNKNNSGHQNKRHEVVRAFTAITGEKKGECPKLKNQNCGNQNGNGGARGRAFVIGGGEARQDPNVVMGTFLLNNCYASILFDSGADRSFVSTAFIPLINITPTDLDVKYNIELANGKKYLQKGCHVFLAHIKEKKSEEKSEEKRLEDVPVVRDFSKDFFKDMPGLPQLDKSNSKSTWFLERHQHVIDSRGIHVDPSKIKAIKDWATPTTLTEIRQFLEKADSTFQLLKQKLCSAPILALPEGAENFVIYCDASHKGLSELEYSLSKSGDTTYMIELLGDYDCDIRYHLGKANIVADALSQKERMKPLRIQTLVMTINSNLPSQILDAHVEAIKKENIKDENLCGMDKEFKIRPDETRCFINMSWLPHFGGLRDLIMHESHESKYSIHPGSDKM
ncbi:reverse transcriptase domain-containing protein [Tanacetum coccineum]